MTLHLVIHRPDAAEGSTAEAAIRSALLDAVWEVAESHWAPCKEVVLVSTDLSPDYLLAHFRQALAQRGHGEPGMLLVAPVGPATAWCGMPADVEAWMAEVR
ncbi:MAG TPA: hypothetical protein VGN83_28810 [Falsiroseomonas sp.]|jgi:hypothetical protein|nr:hypothetical protein [Falsiroseomonas sp.]